MKQFNDIILNYFSVILIALTTLIIGIIIIYYLIKPRYTQEGFSSFFYGILAGFVSICFILHVAQFCIINRFFQSLDEVPPSSLISYDIKEIWVNIILSICFTGVIYAFFKVLSWNLEASQVSFFNTERAAAEQILIQTKLKDRDGKVIPIEGNEELYKKAIFRKINPQGYKRWFPNLTVWLNLHPAIKYLISIFFLSLINWMMMILPTHSILLEQGLTSLNLLFYLLILVIIFKFKFYLKTDYWIIPPAPYSMGTKIYEECCKLLKKETSSLKNNLNQVIHLNNTHHFYRFILIHLISLFLLFAGIGVGIVAVLRGGIERVEGVIEIGIIVLLIILISVLSKVKPIAMALIGAVLVTIIVAGIETVAMVVLLTILILGIILLTLAVLQEKAIFIKPLGLFFGGIGIVLGGVEAVTGFITVIIVVLYFSNRRLVKNFHELRF